MNFGFLLANIRTFENLQDSCNQQYVITLVNLNHRTPPEKNISPHVKQNMLGSGHPQSQKPSPYIDPNSFSSKPFQYLDQNNLDSRSNFPCQTTDSPSHNCNSQNRSSMNLYASKIPIVFKKDIPDVLNKNPDKRSIHVDHSELYDLDTAFSEDTDAVISNPFNIYNYGWVNIEKPMGILFQENKVVGGACVINIIKKGNADREGLVKIGDQLVAVENKTVVGKSLKVVFEYLNRTPSTTKFIVYRGTGESLYSSDGPSFDWIDLNATGNSSGNTHS